MVCRLKLELGRGREGCWMEVVEGGCWDLSFRSRWSEGEVEWELWGMRGEGRMVEETWASRASCSLYYGSGKTLRGIIGGDMLEHQERLFEG